MVTASKSRVFALAAPLALGACLSSPANDYLYSCANGGSCPTGSGCASDMFCHPQYVADAGPADAGAYLCASTSPECPAGQTCESNGLCSAGDAGTELPDAGDAGSSGSCDLATAFGSSTPIACGTDCAGLGVGDFNHDGYADVVVAVDTDDQNRGGLALLLNDGTGNLGSATTTRALYPCDFEDGLYTTPDALAVGDFNGDGWPDLALSLQESSQLALAINNQDGGFTVRGFQPGTSSGCLETEDALYSDISAYQSAGDWYLAAVGYGLMDLSGGSVMAVSLVQGAQTLGPFDLIEPAPDYIPFGLTVGLFDSDPNPGAAVAEENLETEAGQIELFSGTNSGVVSSMASQTLICQQGTARITSADLNGDGLLDLIAVNDVSNTVEIFYAKAGGFRPGVSFATNLGDAGTQPVGAAVADLDRDGRPDIATVNASGSISILKGLSDGGFLLVAMQKTTSQTPYWISAVDLEDHGANDGGLPDLVVSYISGAGSSAIDVFYNGCR